MTDRLEVGRISKAHGIRGEVVVALTTNRDERVAVGTHLWADGRELVVVTSRPHQGHHLVLFEGVSGRDAAESLRGAVLTAEVLDDPDELWVHELVGSEVTEVDGTARGRVDAVQSNPAADLLVLDTGALVPLTFMVERAPGRVVIDPPPGLFDL